MRPQPFVIEIARFDDKGLWSHSTVCFSQFGTLLAAAATTMRGNAVQYASSEMMTRTILLSGEHFSYMKAMHGSFKDRFFGSSLVRVNIALKELIHCVALITHVMSALQFGGTY